MTTRSEQPTPTPLGLAPTFGFGDRLGCATPGHLDALRRAGGPIKGIFAQQSIREMARTKRTAPEVMAAATAALADASFTDAWGADADHLKTPADVRVTADAGFTFFTIDPSDEVDRRADDYSPAELEAKYAAAPDDAPWLADYVGKRVAVAGAPALEFDR
ncbi:MAG: tagaturonate epimerase family protein, partial [Planctomycetia bacterium]